MRITGGKYVRRNVICPPGVIRPAMDRMRESLFSILGDLTGCSFLDLFSGSGCVAIEAASRGADPVHLVEMDRGKKETIEKNLAFVKERKKLFLMDAMTFIRTTDEKYSIIYLDPPFKMEGKIEMLREIEKNDIVKDGGLVIIHYPEEDEKLWKDDFETLHLERIKKYGRSMVRIYEKGESEDVLS